MAARYHYDAQGNYRGYSESEGEHFFGMLVAWIGFPVAIFLGLAWLWERLTSFYATAGAPYKQLLQWYYVILVVPAKLASATSAYAANLTPWPNLNLVLMVIAFLLVFIGIYGGALAVLKRLRRGGVIACIALLGPAALMLAWAIGSLVFGWLFASPVVHR